MAVYIVYVNSPIAGTIQGLSTYCDDATEHLTCGGYPWVNPVDVGGSGNLYLRVNYPNVRSIRTWVGPGCCGDKPCATSDMKRIVTVELWDDSNARCYYMGSVKYGHVANPQVVDNTVYNLTSGTKLLGAVPADAFCAGCFEHQHSHMEIVGGQVISLLGCDDTVSSSTNIYRFTWSDNPPC